jgi:Fis family transcriptional regulator
MKMDSLNERTIHRGETMRESIRNRPLVSCIAQTVSTYLEAHGDLPPRELYRRMLDQVEPPLLDAVMVRARGNQSEAARMLGISRGTLRTKLRRHNML